MSATRVTAGSPVIDPAPVRDLRQVLEMLADMGTVFLHLPVERVHDVGCLRAEARELA
jgi:hypothetical protein